VGSNDVSGGSLDLFFFDNNTSSLIEDIIDSSHRIRGSSNFGLENRFLKRWRSGQFTTIIDSSSGRDKLTTSSVNGIGVEETSIILILTDLMFSSVITASLVAH